MHKIKNIFKSLIGKLISALINILKSKDTTIIYAGPILGDALYSMAFVEEYKKRYPQKRL